MPESTAEEELHLAEEGAPASLVRKRPRAGERRVQILQALASMLEQPGTDRVTTAALAARLEVSEAALYRHFASKAQMFEGLIEFIESSVFSLLNQIMAKADAASVAEPQVLDAGLRQAARMVAVLLQFAEKNPGMTRVMVGDALVLENERLTQRMNLFFDKVEASLRQCLREAHANTASDTPTVDAQVQASVLVAFALGRLQRFTRSGFKRLPTEQLELSLAILL
jgi:TetR/AcrR family transcriptional regulator